MKSESTAYFDDLASSWDEVRKTLFPDSVRDKALTAAGIEPGRLAADLGAGTGFISQALLDAGLRVVAVDQSARMLDQLAKNLGPHPDLDCRLGTAERLPIADSSVDYAFANMYLHHVEDPAEGLAEMSRILKPGGKLVVTDMDRHDFEFLRLEQHDRWPGFERTDIRSWLEQAGLTAVSVDCLNEGCCATSATDGTRAEVSIFLASGTKPADR